MKIKVLLLVLLAASCSVVSSEDAQKIRISEFIDNTPKIIAENEFVVHVEGEKVLDYDMQVIGDNVYVSYVTDSPVFIARRGDSDWGDDGTLTTLAESMTNQGFVSTVEKGKTLITELGKSLIDASKITSLNDLDYILAKVSTSEDKVYFYPYKPNDELVEGDSTISTDSASLFNDTSLRLLKGDHCVGLVADYTLYWELLAGDGEEFRNGAYYDEVSIFKPSYLEVGVAFINSLENSTAVNILLYDVGVGVDVVFLDNFSEKFSTISQLNTWNDNGIAHFSFIGDGTTIVVGKHDNYLYSQVSSMDMKYTITDYQVEMGSSEPYALWVNNSSKQMLFASFTPNSTTKSDWTELDRVNYVSVPRLYVGQYMDINGRSKEDVFVGTMNTGGQSFQLLRLEDLQLNKKGESVSATSINYAITGNTYGQVLYMRFDMAFLPEFMALNSVTEWEYLMPIDGYLPEYEVDFLFGIDAVFLSEEHIFTMYVQEGGSLYGVSGIKY